MPDNKAGEKSRLKKLCPIMYKVEIEHSNSSAKLFEDLPSAKIFYSATFLGLIHLNVSGSVFLKKKTKSKWVTIEHGNPQPAL